MARAVVVMDTTAFPRLTYPSTPIYTVVFTSKHVISFLQTSHDTGVFVFLVDLCLCHVASVALSQDFTGRGMKSVALYYMCVRDAFSVWVGQFMCLLI